MGAGGRYLNKTNRDRGVFRHLSRWRRLESATFVRQSAGFDLAKAINPTNRLNG